MKYNIGDKVVRKSNLTMLFNPYHKAEKRRGLIHTITEATETLFTIYTDNGIYKSALENARSFGINQYIAYRQESGGCLT